jgi:hypothetical protein
MLMDSSNIGKVIAPESRAGAAEICYTKASFVAGTSMRTVSTIDTPEHPGIAALNAAIRADVIRFQLLKFSRVVRS